MAPCEASKTCRLKHSMERKSLGCSFLFFFLLAFVCYIKCSLYSLMGLLHSLSLLSSSLDFFSCAMALLMSQKLCCCVWLLHSRRPFNAFSSCSKSIESHSKGVFMKCCTYKRWIKRWAIYANAGVRILVCWWIWRAINTRTGQTRIAR